MSSTLRLLAVGPIMMLVSTGALAQADEKAVSDSRFIYEQVDEGILRLDSRTGEVSLCNRQEIGWTCRLVADESRAVGGEVGRLERENTALRKLLADRAQVLPSAGAPATLSVPEAAPFPAPPRKNAETRGPIFDRTIEVVGTIWRRLVEMMANVQTDLRKKT